MKFGWYTLRLAAVILLVFILQNIYEPLTEEFLLNSSEALYKPWMFVTHIFLHGSVSHIFFNLFALVLFGSILEAIIGKNKLLFIFFASGIVAGFGSFLIYPASLGASGAIMGILGTLAVLRPRMIVYVSYIPMPMSVAVIFWALGDIFGLFFPSDVANLAHLAGLAAGLIYGLILREKYGKKYPKRLQYKQIGEQRFREWEDEWM